MIEKALLIAVIVALFIGAGAVGHAASRPLCDVAAALSGGQARCAP